MDYHLPSRRRKKEQKRPQKKEKATADPNCALHLGFRGQSKLLWAAYISQNAQGAFCVPARYSPIFRSGLDAALSRALSSFKKIILNTYIYRHTVVISQPSSSIGLLRSPSHFASAHNSIQRGAVGQPTASTGCPALWTISFCLNAHAQTSEKKSSLVPKLLGYCFRSIFLQLFFALCILKMKL